jgi:hypothetical protein
MNGDSQGLSRCCGSFAFRVLCWRQDTEKVNDHGMVSRKNSAPHSVFI